jgi:hypothetical protein
MSEAIVVDGYGMEDGWQPIETARPETRIWMGFIADGRLKRVGMGRISKRQDSKLIEYQRVHNDVARSR